MKLGLWGDYMMRKLFLKKHIPSATLTDTTGRFQVSSYILYLVTDKSLWLCVFGPIPDYFCISFFPPSMTPNVMLHVSLPADHMKFH